MAKANQSGQASFGASVLEGFGGDEAAQAAVNEVAQAIPDSQPAVPAATPAIEPPVSAPVEQPAVDPFLSALTELGFDGVTDPNVGRDRLLESYRLEAQRRAEAEAQVNQLRQLEQIANAAQEWYQDPEIRRMIDQRQSPQAQRPMGQQPPQVQPTEQPTGWWNPPAVNASVVAQYRERRIDPATSEIVEDWKPGTPMSVRTAYEDHQRYLQEWSSRLVNDPVQAFQPIEQNIRNTVLQEVQAMVRREFENQHLERKTLAVQQRIAHEDNWVFQRDPRTGQVMQDGGGRYVLSPEGQQAYDAVNQLTQMGVTDPEQQWNMARAQVIANNKQLAATVFGFGAPALPGASNQPPSAAQNLIGGAPAAPIATPAAQAKARQNAYLKRQAGTAPPPNRDGISQPNGQTPRASFGRTAAAAMAEGGFTFDDLSQ